ncbi:MAG: type I DNA topoisomerase [Geminicoccaceae bacterium]|nr:type I DNA topoisomerase [Geminicoccaceae bacterium]
MDVVVVESPTKAKTINKYLGSDYQVLSSYGHVRDLLDKDGAVVPDDDFRMHYVVMAEKKKRVDEIAKAVRGARHLFLATDPDREGEAISWHLLAALAEKKALGDVDVKRVVFHEVTRKAVLDAMQHPRDLDAHLIDAYQARRALDYLVGFTLSPVLWRKMPGSRSAGRVQSVALRLICDRESEIEAFRAQEFWTVEALLKNGGGPFTARLTHMGDRKLDKFALGDEAAAKAAVAAVERAALQVRDVEKKQVGRNPSPPFSTSTLQQEASRKLGFSADRAMKTAQRLFEGAQLDGETVGLITYMRTDSVQLSSEALGATRRLIDGRFGKAYLPEKPRVYKTKTKNAQEAHEAIRPTDLFRTPQQIGRYLDDDQRRLYELIWKRTVASQMAAAVMNRVTVDIADAAQSVALRATGQTVAFDGFLKLYQEGRDEPSEDDEEAVLPDLTPGTKLAQEKVTPSQHFTEPPPRYSEASLVKKLEELGIGRPSTYASIISVLQARDYVRLEQRRFVPEDRGRMVTVFLTNFFDRYVQPAFTAGLEDELDAVAAGEKFWKEVLREFWPPFEGVAGEVMERRTAEIIDILNETLATTLFPPREDGSDPRICPLCGDGALSLKLGRFGAFVGCANYPECRYTRKLGEDGAAAEARAASERMLGVDPESEEEVWLKTGRFGPYVQAGSGKEAKRSSLPPSLTPDDVTFEIALRLLALPRTIGHHPETQKPVTAGINKFGPFIAHEGKYVRLGEDDDVLTIGMNRAVSLLAEAPQGRARGGGQKVLRELGAHPDDEKPVQILDGRFGPYVKHGKTNASLKKGMEVEALSLEEAMAMLAAKAGAPKKAGRKTAAAKAPGKKVASAGKAPAKKAASAKKAPAKKAPVKKVEEKPVEPPRPVAILRKKIVRSDG